MATQIEFKSAKEELLRRPMTARELDLWERIILSTAGCEQATVVELPVNWADYIVAARRERVGHRSAFQPVAQQDGDIKES
jgi:hypothetical protein